MCVYSFFFFKQKTAYEMRISDWSSDVCSSDLPTYGGSMRGDIADQAPRRSVTDVRGAGNRLDTPCRRLHVQCRVAKKGAWRSFFVWGTRSQQIGRASCRERVGQYV